MNFEQLNSLKGFMPSHEGLALNKWAEEFSNKLPIFASNTGFFAVLKPVLPPTNDRFLKPKNCCDIVKKI